MAITENSIEEKKYRLINCLNQSLCLEYSFLIHYPRIASTISDPEIRKLILSLGDASMQHADVVAGIINELGGQPDWSFDPYPDGLDVKKLFAGQLIKEKQALQLHQMSADLVAAPSMRSALLTLAETEEKHIQVVERILSKLAA